MEGIMNMNHPQAPPSVSYLRFVRDQANILARRAQRSGLRERARHYWRQEDWATGLLDAVFEAFEQDCSKRVERKGKRFSTWASLYLDSNQNASE